MDKIDPLCINHQLKKMKGSTGSCGWSIKELKGIPEMYEQLSQVFNGWELCGLLPSVTKECTVTLIPKKEEKSHYKSMRPITVLSVVYRIYAGLRTRNVLVPELCEVLKILAQDAQVPEIEIYGGLTNKSCRDLVTALNITMERLSIEGGNFHPIS